MKKQKKARKKMETVIAYHFPRNRYTVSGFWSINKHLNKRKVKFYLKSLPFSYAQLCTEHTIHMRPWY